MGMTKCQLDLVRAVAENNLQEAKKYAVACCAEDTTQKNRHQVEKCLKILKNEEKKLAELPLNIRDFSSMEDLSEYREGRYFLSEREGRVISRIQDLYQTAQWLAEKGIPYHNMVLLYGESGVGKTEFSRYAAYTLGLPYLYVNLSQMVGSYLGTTAKNMTNVFNFINNQPCLLMIDEIDAIATKRAYADSGASAEIARATTCLIQLLDRVQNGHVILAATNVPEMIDPAVKRRFSEQYEIRRLDAAEKLCFIRQYFADVDIPYDLSSVEAYAKQDVTQAEIVGHIVRSIVDMKIKGNEKAVL